MGNFEKLSVLVIVVIIVMILVVALYTWTDNPDQTSGGMNSVATANEGAPQPPVAGPGMDVVQIPGPTLAKDAKDKAQPVTSTPKTLAEMLEEAKVLGAKPVEPLPPVPPPAPAPAAAPAFKVVGAPGPRPEGEEGEAGEAQIADGDAHQAQSRMAHGGGHVPHLAIAALGERQLYPGGGNGPAEPHGRIARRQRRLARQQGCVCRAGAIVLDDQAFA